MEGGLGKEDVLHHEMLEMRERLARMVEIGVRHRRILAQDVHALDHVGMHRLHDLDHRKPALGIELGAPGPLDLGADVGVLHRPIVGEEHRDETGVGGALHVVLAAQRMQPGAGPPDLPADQCERDQAARIVGAVHMLRHAHAPEDDRRPRPRIASRHRAQRIGGDTADRRHLLGSEVLDVLGEGLEVRGLRLDILPVVEPFGDDGIEDAVEHRDVGAGLELQHVGGVALERLAARIHDDELGAALGRLLEEGSGDRMVLGRDWRR